ncbi:MAG: hypothetical protein ACXWPX_10495, partial [Pseudobdellovibrio sp.]
MSEENNNNSGSKKIIKSYLEHHGRPLTRREMLASGVIPFAATVAMPNWLHMFAKAGVAQAQDLVCTSGSASTMPTLVQIKLNGGAAMSYNFLPTGQGGQLLASYDRIGGGTGANIPIVNAFSNNAMFYGSSGMYAGMSTVVQPTTFQRSVFVGIPVSSQDDSSNNKFGISGIIERMGMKGSLLPSLGHAQTITGIPAVPAVVAPAAPLTVGSYEDILGALGVDGALSSLSSDQKIKLFQTIQGLTAGQVASLAGLSGGATLSRLMQCSNITNSNLMSNSGSLNTSPLSNASFATLWGINNNTSTSSQDFVFATMVYNAINGNAGVASFDMGGFDYHNNPRAVTDGMDNSAGVVIGKVLQSFAVMNKPGFIVVCSDGSVSSTQSDTPGAPYASDRGLSGCVYMIAYHPSRLLKATSQQIGFLTSGQAADSTTVPTGNDPEKAIAAAALNYALMAGIPVSTFQTAAPNV